MLLIDATGVSEIVPNKKTDIYVYKKCQQLTCWHFLYVF